MNGKQMLTGAYRSALKVAGGRGLGRVYPFSAFNAWLNTRALPQLKTDEAMVHGHTMRLDARDSLGLSIWGTWEPFETELIQTLVQPGDVVVDVGANIGYYTLLLARRVGAQGRVFAFEPAPENFAILQENVARNGYQNVVLEQKALADTNGFAMLALSNTNHGDHRLQNSSAANETVTVETTTLDAYLGEVAQNVTLVKMDVQGAEMRVLRGMKNLLARQSPLTLVLEFFPAALEQMGEEPREMLELLRANNFVLQEIIEKPRELRAVDDLWYEREHFGDEGLTNLLCVKTGA